MTPDRDRKAAERARKKAAGLVAVTVWVRPEHRGAIKECAAMLERPVGSLLDKPAPAADG